MTHASGNSTPLLGAHVSAAGGFLQVLSRAHDLGAGVVQIFGSSPRQWITRMPRPDDLAVFRAAREASGVSSLFLHGAYLVNLASPDAELRARSEKNLAEHLMIANLLGADGLIFHIGSGKEMPKDEAMRVAGAAMRRILHASPGPAMLIIENTAGGGQKLGSNPEEIARILEIAGSDRIAACFDTQHAFAGGALERFDDAELRRVFSAWDDAVGLERIKALHINDSKSAFNSRRDLHENIGEGHIGLDGFRHLAAGAGIRHAAWILEVPGFAGEGPDLENMNILRSLF